MSATLAEKAQALGLLDIDLTMDKLALRAADEKWTYEQFLTEVLSHQCEMANERSCETLLRFAGFPYHKTIDNFDFSFQKSISKRVIEELGECAFIRRNENIVFLGPPGTGKTHLAIALGIEATKKRMRVRFTACSSLITKLLEAKERNTYSRRLSSYTSSSLLIIDEVGFNPLSTQDAALLFDVICKRYEHGSIILTSNKSYSEWAEIFCGDTVIATAMLDRLLHHSKSFALKGESYRMKEFKENKE